MSEDIARLWETAPDWTETIVNRYDHNNDPSYWYTNSKNPTVDTVCKHRHANGSKVYDNVPIGGSEVHVISSKDGQRLLEPEEIVPGVGCCYSLSSGLYITQDTTYEEGDIVEVLRVLTGTEVVVWNRRLSHPAVINKKFLKLINISEYPVREMIDTVMERSEGKLNGKIELVGLVVRKLITNGFISK